MCRSTRAAPWSPGRRRPAGRAHGADYDFGGVFAPVAPIIGAADLALCHLETPLGPPGGPFEPGFRSCVPILVTGSSVCPGRCRGSVYRAQKRLVTELGPPSLVELAGGV